MPLGVVQRINICKIFTTILPLPLKCSSLPSIKHLGQVSFIHLGYDQFHGLLVKAFPDHAHVCGICFPDKMPSDVWLASSELVSDFFSLTVGHMRCVGGIPREPSNIYRYKSDVNMDPGSFQWDAIINVYIYIYIYIYRKRESKCPFCPNHMN